jgi:elongation factor Ts
MDCKRALEESNGDLGVAEGLLKSAGLAAAAKKSHRETREGIVEAYVHSGSRIGALIEIGCETDFVARTDIIKNLAHDLAMQVAAMAPTYIGEEDLDPNETRPAEEVCLLLQTFIKDPSLRVQEVVQEAIARVGENVRVSRFGRFALGE